MEKVTDILVFKTNIKTQEDTQQIKGILDAHTKIQEWTIDTQDVDCVLRILAEGISIDEVIFHLAPTGYACAELDA